MTAKPIDEARIRTLAYHLWEQEGSPDGHADDHWHRARTQLEAESQKAAAPAPRKVTRAAPARSTRASGK